MAKKFDKSRNHATVHGSTVGVVYRQDGKYFNQAGDEVDEITGMLVNPAPPPTPKASPPKSMLTVDPPIIPDADAAMASRQTQPIPPAVVQDPPPPVDKVDYDPSKIDPENLSRADFEFWAENEEGFKKAIADAGRDPIMWNDFKEQARKAFGVDLPSKKLWAAHIKGDPVPSTE